MIIYSKNREFLFKNKDITNIVYQHKHHEIEFVINGTAEMNMSELHSRQSEKPL